MSAKLDEMLRIAEAATQGPTAMPGEQRVIDDEIYVTMLLAYQQADMDGTMVLASRQAIHETVDALRATKGQLRDALAEVAMMTRMLTDPPAGHGETCPACNEKINGVTGNAANWPMLFAPLEDVGPVWHHRGCVHGLYWNAESALAATKAKLEALEKIAAETLEAYGALLGDYSSYSPHWTEIERATDRLAAALTTKETTDATSI